ncbi:hypothetical protein IPZ58_35815 [Streptomyces roseoverticillatus]|uniref:hypothetical protein n=1 Tax=Streptomyces roseoverticillatus TaxID=66429 RepID=UPI001F3D7822|nr:hypothetical protein [Streptomyces roseoverticillatus]MCF3106891.1 hypothetical protein [Streptomyces roseoverticillatus]
MSTSAITVHADATVVGPREGHERPHFTAFADYRLLSEDKTKETRGGKDASARRHRRRRTP